VRNNAQTPSLIYKENIRRFPVLAPHHGGETAGIDMEPINGVNIALYVEIEEENLERRDAVGRSVGGRPHAHLRY